MRKAAEYNAVDIMEEWEGKVPILETTPIYFVKRQRLGKLIAAAKEVLSRERDERWSCDQVISERTDEERAVFGRLFRGDADQEVYEEGIRTLALEVMKKEARWRGMPLSLSRNGEERGRMT